jgi:hypothetical protein
MTLFDPPERRRTVPDQSGDVTMRRRVAALPEPKFGGDTYEPEHDSVRLGGLLARVEAFMRDGAWRTLPEIVASCGGTEASVSARLRDLRKPKFGRHTVERRRHPDLAMSAGVFQYRLRKDQP